MTYTFVADISKEEYLEYVSSFSGAPIFQSASWAAVKNNWAPVYLGVRNEAGALSCATLMLIRRIAPLFAFGYCNRGPLADLCDKEILRVFTEGIKKYAVKHGLCYVKFDPFLPVSVTPPSMEETQFSDVYSGNIESYKASFDNLLSLGYVHKGFSKVLNDYIQPRYNMVVPLKNRAGDFLSEGELKRNVRSVKKFLGSFADNRGIFTEIPEVTDGVLTEFTRLIHSTEERQGIYLRGKDYFKQLTDAYGDNARIIFVKCRVTVYRDYLMGRLEKEPENGEKITSLIAEAESVISQRGEVITLGGLLVVLPPNVEGIRMAEYLYAGADLSVFSSFSATSIGLYEAMRFCIEQKCDLLDLGGVEGTLDDGLYNFKSHFGAFLVEYYGEFDLIVSSLKYKIIEKYLPLAVRVYKKIVRKITGTENKKQ